MRAQSKINKFARLPGLTSILRAFARRFAAPGAAYVVRPPSLIPHFPPSFCLLPSVFCLLPPADPIRTFTDTLWTQPRFSGHPRDTRGTQIGHPSGPASDRQPLIPPTLAHRQPTQLFCAQFVSYYSIVLSHSLIPAAPAARPSLAPIQWIPGNRTPMITPAEAGNRHPSPRPSARSRPDQPPPTAPSTCALCGPSAAGTGSGQCS